VTEFEGSGATAIRKLEGPRRPRDTVSVDEVERGELYRLLSRVYGAWERLLMGTGKAPAEKI